MDLPGQITGTLKKINREGESNYDPFFNSPGYFMALKVYTVPDIDRPTIEFPHTLPKVVTADFWVKQDGDYVVIRVAQETEFSRRNSILVQYGIDPVNDVYNTVEYDISNLTLVGITPT